MARNGEPDSEPVPESGSESDAESDSDSESGSASGSGSVSGSEPEADSEMPSYGAETSLTSAPRDVPTVPASALRARCSQVPEGDNRYC